MNVKTEPAVCSGGSPKQTASNNQLTKAYPKAESLSSLKSEIGILLLCLQFPIGHEVSQIGWTLFERLLRRYVRRRISQSAFQRRSGCAESSNASQRVSG
jgi:hypothetical protein